MIVPAIAGLIGVIVMNIFLRAVKIFNVPESQMIRAIGSIVTKNADTAMVPGTILHAIGGLFFAYVYYVLIHFTPEISNEMEGGAVIFMFICGLIGIVHGLLVTLFLVISVAQYHPLERYRSMEPSDMAAHVIAHGAYGATVGFMIGWLPTVL